MKHVFIQKNKIKEKYLISYKMVYKDLHSLNSKAIKHLPLLFNENKFSFKKHNYSLHNILIYYNWSSQIM